MCAISSSPEAGDATDIMSTRRKWSAISGTEDIKNTFLTRRDEKNADLRCVPSNLINKLKDNVREEFSLTMSRDNSRRRTGSNEREVTYYGFPYYRSNATNGLQDAILVKDVGVSCRLLNENVVDPDMSISGFESYLVRQLKLEYNELSSITRKINAYTKDILRNLASRCRKKDQALKKLHVASKRVMALQYTDKTGKPCLKLRLRDDVERKDRPSKMNLSSNISSEKEIGVKRRIRDNACHWKHTSTKERREQLDRAFPKGIHVELSPKCSGLLLRNYLLTKREKVPNRMSKVSLSQDEDLAPPGRSCKGRDADKSRRSFYASERDSPVFTNWKEVSRRKESRSKSAFTASTSGES